MKMVLEVEPRRCIGCGKCELACAFGHGKGGALGRSCVQVVDAASGHGTPLLCLQCLDAGCAAVCPSHALARDQATGAIALDRSRCLHCGLCAAACPFGQIRWNGAEPEKCDLCGGEPRCAPFCPSGALRIVG